MTTEGDNMAEFYVFADDNPQVDEEGRDFIQLAERASDLATVEQFEADPEFQEAAEYAETIGRPVALYKVVRVRAFGEKEEQND